MKAVGDRPSAIREYWRESRQLCGPGFGNADGDRRDTVWAASE
jgi:hypothetical protein